MVVVRQIVVVIIGVVVVVIVEVVVIVMKVITMNNIDIYICIKGESNNTIM